MFDALKLLGSLAQNNTAPSAGNRFGAAASQAGGSPLGQLLSQFGGGSTPFQAGAPGGPQGSGGGLGGMLGGFADMARRAAASPQQEVRNNNPAAVGGLGALAGALLGGGEGALGGGLMAVLGSLAYSAMQGHGAGAAGTAQAPAVPATSGDAQRKATLMIRAMIQAAKADGQIDPQETQRIMGKLDGNGHDEAARGFVQDEMRRPIDLAGLVRNVTSPQEAAEVYAASLMAIEVDSQAERDYLTDLAAALNLPASVTSRINSTLGVSI